MGINVHGLLHLVDVVTDLNPLWVTSCFLWESLNGDLTTSNDNDETDEGYRVIDIRLISVLV